MKQSPRFSFRGVLALAVLASGLTLPQAHAADWVDTNGNAFNGDPAGLLGPLALLKSGRARGQRLPLANLKPEDALRYDQGLRELPARAKRWADGKSQITKELRGSVRRIKDGTLTDTDLNDRMEPELLLVFFVESGGDAREIFRAAIPLYNGLQAKYGDDFEMLFVGVNHTMGEHISLAESLQMPWLVMKKNRQSRLDEIAMFAPDPAPGYALLSREGVPITKASGIITSDVDKIFQQLEGLLVAMVPNNPRTWMQRVAYYKNVRLAEFAQGSGDPYLVGPPLLDKALAQIGVTAFELTAEVDENGRATSVVVEPGPGIPDKYLTAVAKAFGPVPFVPAVKNGQFVPGTLHYRYSSH
ncbi:hypothetical protein [Synoicihabitans lomoniglobus]|uniref:TonB C-terminal domain-containing protein n=1 Tax=Synoicihabitans lomoniglobus TaxID=2909285 RepID=A0AAF0I2L4_9BACT|nr:hypothetical protein [Opitutaceae bacterium LMO-M01]WED66597.1 hypothetical protein PXH66_07010 [Opitutaceae bacterium LMO-M01]